MKQIKIAVLATAALALVAFNTYAGNDSYAPDSTGAKIAVTVDPVTHVQNNPASLVQIFGFNGDISNSIVPNATGTNIIISPKAPVLYLVGSTNVNIAHATNVAAGTYWNTRLVIKSDVINRTLTVPSFWQWRTNAADTNQITGKTTTISSNSLVELSIQAFGTNIAIGATTYHQ